ncbi:SURF1 family cytochrome oxidase biogenesis protein [Amycolatopsis deserti]|uniref:SURF1 family cytochrome oxidase biogenesis protein n=1 Tax=Amycolatopsis deserti TaxID=185696 RepID=UPI001E3D7BEA|nr:SURF1 family protein [Amycolatopsis deserti]
MRLKFLLRPSWLALVVGVLAFAFACFTLLSPWQFSRNDQREAQNRAIEASLTADPRPLNDVLPRGATPDVNTEWSRVEITGTYLPEQEVVARLRTVQGQPAFEVLTPFRTTDGQIVLVDRGYLQPDSRTEVPPYAAPPAGTVTIVARIREDENDPKNRDAFADASTHGKLQSYTVDSRVVARSSGLDIRSGYFQLDSDQPGVLNPLPLPQTDAGPFFSYALQWIAFGVMAIAGLLYFTIREMKPGGVLNEMAEKNKRKRRSVAEILAEDEAAARSASVEGGGGRRAGEAGPSETAADRADQPAQRN